MTCHSKWKRLRRWHPIVLTVVALLICRAEPCANAENQAWLWRRIGRNPCCSCWRGPILRPTKTRKYSIEATRFEGTDKRFSSFRSGRPRCRRHERKWCAIRRRRRHQIQDVCIDNTRESARRQCEFSWCVPTRTSTPSKDLKGKSIGIVSLSSNSQLQVQVMLERNGMSLDDVSLVPTPFPAEYEALKSGLIDVGSFPQPYLAMAKHLGNVRTIFTAKDAAPYEEELLVLIGQGRIPQAKPAGPLKPCSSI